MAVETSSSVVELPIALVPSSVAPTVDADAGLSSLKILARASA